MADDTGPITLDKAEETMQRLIGPPTPEETKLLANEIALSDARLKAIQDQADVQGSIFAAMGFDPKTGKYDATKATLKPGELDPEMAAQVDTIFGQEMSNAMEDIRENLAPSRGLRATDTPIQDRAFRVGGEIASGAAKAKLDLSQRAFLNRVAMLEGAGQMGLGLAQATGTSPGTVATNLMGNRYSVAPTTINTSGGGVDLAGMLDWASEFDWGNLIS